MPLVDRIKYVADSDYLPYKNTRGRMPVDPLFGNPQRLSRTYLRRTVQINDFVRTHIVLPVSSTESEAEAAEELQQNKDHDKLFIEIDQMLEAERAGVSNSHKRKRLGHGQSATRSTV